MGLHAARLFLEIRQLLLKLRQALAARCVLLLLERLALDLKLHDLTLHHVDLGGKRINLDPQAAGGLVDKIDGLVRKEAIGDVAVGEGGRGHDGRVGDLHTVVDLVLFLEASKNRNGVLARWLAHVHGLEASLERRILLHVLAVLIQRRGTHAA